MSNRDILADGDLVVPAAGSASSPWISTQGLKDVVVLLKFPGASGLSAAVQESHDSSAVLYEWGFTAGVAANTFRVVVQPGAASLRLFAANSEGANQTVTYSIRALV